MIDHEFNNEKDAWEWINQQLQEFKIKNAVKDESKDKYYLRYKSGLMDGLYSQITNSKDDFHFCKECPEEFWEGEDKNFCRCEDRNIRVARVKRIKSYVTKNLEGEKL